MSIIAFGAHYDDLELGCGGTLAKLAHQSDVIGVVATNSEYGSRTKEIAHREGVKAAEILGYKLRSMDYPTQGLIYGGDLIQRCESLIKICQPDIIILPWPHDAHQDHATLGRAVLTAARYYNKVLCYRSNFHSSTVEFIPNFFVDLSGDDGIFLKMKIRAIRAHASETRKRGRDWVQFYSATCRAAGAKIGMKYAEEFHMVKWAI